MKNLAFITTMVLLGLMTTTAALASPRHFSGKWQCTVSGSEIELFPTDYGFKSRYLDQNDWRHYEETYHNNYFDAAGNHFEWRDDIWHFGSANGAKHMAYKPFASQVNYASHNNSNIGYNQYDEYQYGDRSTYGLGGTWRARNSRSTLQIQGAQKGISILRNGDYNWERFKRTNRSTFKNGRGDKIKVIGRDRIEWRSHCGRYREVYDKGPNHYRNDQRRNRNRDRNRGGNYSSCSG